MPNFMKIKQGIHPWMNNFAKFGIFGKFGTHGESSPLLHARFNDNWCSVSPLHGQKPQICPK